MFGIILLLTQFELSQQEFNAKKVPILFIDIAEAFGHHDIGEDADLAVKRVLDDIRCVTC